MIAQFTMKEWRSLNSTLRSLLMTSNIFLSSSGGKIIEKKGKKIIVPPPTTVSSLIIIFGSYSFGYRESYRLAVSFWPHKLPEPTPGYKWLTAHVPWYIVEPVYNRFKGIFGGFLPPREKLTPRGYMTGKYMTEIYISWEHPKPRK